MKELAAKHAEIFGHLSKGGKGAEYARDLLQGEVRRDIRGEKFDNVRKHIEFADRHGLALDVEEMNDLLHDGVRNHVRTAAFDRAAEHIDFLMELEGVLDGEISLNVDAINTLVHDFLRRYLRRSSEREPDFERAAKYADFLISLGRRNAAFSLNKEEIKTLLQDGIRNNADDEGLIYGFTKFASDYGVSLLS